MKKEIVKEDISKARIDLENLYEEYKSIDSTLSIFNRWKKSKNRGVFNIFYIILGLIFCLFRVECLIINIEKYIMYIIIICIIIILITYFKNSNGLKRYSIEIVKSRDEELCNMLRKYHIDSSNIDDVIEYFSLRIKPTKEIYVHPTIVNDLLSFFSRTFYLISGIVISEFFKNGNRMTYVNIVAVLIFISILILMLKTIVHTRYNNDYKYVAKIQKFVLELEMIKTLNK